MTQNISRAEKALEKLAIRTGMTEAGKQWLIAAIDPFHDDTLKVIGYPDMVGGASVVQCIKQTVTVAIPPAITVGNWDCLISTDNILSYGGVAANYNMYGNLFIPPATSLQTSLGGLKICGGVPNANLSYVAFPTGVNASFVNGLQYPPGNVRRRLRILSYGFEAHNITSELNKQGSVTVFEQPQGAHRYSGFVTNGAATALSCPLTGVAVQLAPTSLGNAMLLPGSKTWDASAGAYCVCTMNSLDNPPVIADFATPVGASTFDNNYPQVANQTVFMPPFGGTQGSFNYSQMNYVIPYNTKGMYFAGLSATSVLQINFNIWVERFPSEVDGDLTLLASPSAEFDPVAMEAYARIIRMMPVGVPVCENGFGDWFVGGVSFLIDSLIGAPILSNLNLAVSDYIDGTPRNRRTKKKQSAADTKQLGNSWAEAEREVQIQRPQQKKNGPKKAQSLKPGPVNPKIHKTKAEALQSFRDTGVKARYRAANGQIMVVGTKA